MSLGPSEEWRAIPDLPDYEASSLGRLRSKRRGGWHVINGWTTGRPGYRYVNVFIDGRKRNRTVHSLVCAAFHGPRPFGLEVCHGDGDHLNNVPENLRWDTPSGNRYDSVRHGTHRWSRRAA